MRRCSYLLLLLLGAAVILPISAQHRDHDQEDQDTFQLNEATIGQIEGDALFYLRSRGIDEVSARKLLLFAFASECLDRMGPGPVRRYVEGLINRCLFQMANSAPSASTGNRGEDTGRNWEEI